MKSDLGWSYSQAGWMSTVNAIGYIIGASTAAFTIRSVGGAKIYGLGSLIAVFSIFALGMTDDFSVLSVFRILSGISGVWIFVAGGTLALTLAARLRDKHSTVTGIFYAGAGFGLFATGLAVPGWQSRFGAQSWQSA